jgi:hypothetical protein
LATTKALPRWSCSAAVFNIPTPKDDISGKDVGRVYWEENDLERIATYCAKDVVTIARLYLKYRMAGELHDEQVHLSFVKSLFIMAKSADGRAILSKSTFIRGLQCEKSLYLHKKRPFLRDRLSPEQLAKFSRGTNVGVYAQELFPGRGRCCS